MFFNSTIYKKEMYALVDKAIERMKVLKPKFDIYTASIWTDPNAAVSSISFDSHENSALEVQRLKQYIQKHNEKTADEEYGFVLPNYEGRNKNPADFELRNFILIENIAFKHNWETNSKGKCWIELNPVLKEIGDYAFKNLQDLDLNRDFELAVNGENDWYSTIWRLDK